MLALMTAVLMTLSVGPVAGHAARPSTDDWVLLGTRKVNYRAERDVITATHQGRFHAIKIEVDGGNLEMYNIRVTFGDGESFSPDTRINFREGSWSRTIDLPGAERVVRRVEFFYRSEGRRGRATVRVYGLGGGAEAGVGRGRDEHEHDHDDKGRPGEPGEGWRRLGERLVSFRAERDVISGLGDGRFRKIMIVVKDADLEMFDVRVVFGNGESFSPATRLHFGSDSRSRVIDLPGDARTVRRVEFAYKSVAGGGDGRANVEVFGK